MLCVSGNYRLISSYTMLHLKNKKKKKKLNKKDVLFMQQDEWFRKVIG